MPKRDPMCEETLDKVGADLHDEFRTTYSPVSLHVSVERLRPDVHGQHPRVDVFYDEERGCYDIYSDYHSNALYAWTGDPDIDSGTIEDTVRDYMEKDYK